MKSYRLRPPIPDEAHTELSLYPELLRELLYYRGIVTRKDAEVFLNPSYDEHTHDPFLISAMDRAVERVLRAIRGGERIVIYSDYDHDGIPGGVILHDFFKKIGYENFENYIPHRYHEGYGLNTRAVETLFERGAKLLITVDCGISDVKPVERANELGFDVIITDHHLSQGTLPSAYAILNSKQGHCTYPFDMLCGAAVAWKLVQALIQRGNFSLTPGWEKWLLDLVGLSTVADMVPLLGENRVLARYGLGVLRKTPRPGLLKLLRHMRINPAQLTEDDVGYMIAPRINAASRMGDPKLAFDLLSAREWGPAELLARELNKLNDARKGVVGSMVREMHATLEKRGEPPAVIVLGNPTWRPGLLGLAANNLMESYGRPVFLWGREGLIDDFYYKGSCRSDGTVNLVDLMAKVPKDVLRDFGGHALSGGFSVSAEGIYFFEKHLLEAYTQTKNDGVKEEVFIDKKASLQLVSQHTWEVLSMLSPFGISNPKPLFLFERVLIKGVRRFGKTKNHLEILLNDDGGNEVKAIQFFTDENKFPKEGLREGEKINVIGHIERSFFNNASDLRIRVEAFA